MYMVIKELNSTLATPDCGGACSIDLRVTPGKRLLPTQIAALSMSVTMAWLCDSNVLYGQAGLPLHWVEAVNSLFCMVLQSSARKMLPPFFVVLKRTKLPESTVVLFLLLDVFGIKILNYIYIRLNRNLTTEKDSSEAPSNSVADLGCSCRYKPRS